MRFVDENVAELERRLPAPLLGRVPRLDEPTAAAAATHIELASLPGWPAKRA
jgi:dethiobiotin synthetase